MLRRVIGNVVYVSPAVVSRRPFRAFLLFAGPLDRGLPPTALCPRPFGTEVSLSGHLNQLIVSRYFTSSRQLYCFVPAS